MGVMWSFLNPMFMLIIYTFVFSNVFKARWGGSIPENKFEFAIMLFVGMIIHGLFAETLNRAPGLILSNTNYVKKVVFPLEILPVAVIGAALFHALVSVLVLTVFFIVLNGFVQWTIVFLPLVLCPLVLMTIGMAWALSSLGVFLRDVAQPIGMIMTALLFASPVLYPLTALPEYIRPWLMLNPLTFPIEQARRVIISGQIPNWEGLVIYTGLSISSAWIGYAWFQKTRKGFADVL